MTDQPLPGITVSYEAVITAVRDIYGDALNNALAGQAQYKATVATAQQQIANLNGELESLRPRAAQVEQLEQENAGLINRIAELERELKEV